MVRGAIRRAADRSALVARVSPQDLAACRAAIPGIMEEMGGISRLEVVDDPRVSPGSCLLETNAGDVDATVESQLARILEALAAPPDETLVQGSAVSLVDLGPARTRLRVLDPYRMNGRVSELIGLVVESRGPEASVGERCEIHVPGTRTGAPPLQAEVVGFREGKTLLMPLGDASGVGPGQTVVASGGAVQVDVGAGPARPRAGRPRPPDRRPARPGDRGAPAHRRARRPTCCAAPRSASPWPSASGPSTRSCRAGAASGSASSPDRAWARARRWG